jgi:acetyltransferase-like isoleucine patch superfamily enzyme
MAKQKLIVKSLKLGVNLTIDKTAIIGYLPARKIKIYPTIIGKNTIIRTNAIIYTNSIIGKNFETGHNVVIREQNKIGDNVCIWSNSVIDYGCSIGNNVKIHNNVYLAQFTVVEDDVFIGPGVVTANDLCPVCKKCMKGPVIEKGAKIGAGVTLLPHITIGQNCLIGAGSVVTKNIPKDSVAYGNPARVVKAISKLNCRFGIIKNPAIISYDKNNDSI